MSGSSYPDDTGEEGSGGADSDGVGAGAEGAGATGLVGVSGMGGVSGADEKQPAPSKASVARGTNQNGLGMMEVIDIR